MISLQACVFDFTIEPFRKIHLDASLMCGMPSEYHSSNVQCESAVMKGQLDA